MKFEKILIAVDEDSIAAHAAEAGIDLARSVRARVALVHAIDPSLICGEAGMPADELALAAKRDGTRLMADFRALLPAGTNALQFVVRGPVGPEIAEAAKEWEAALTVIGSHRRCGITRALVGSLAEAVMRHAPCPALVVGAEE